MWSPTDVPLGRLERVDPRTVWKHEAHHFTPWLKANADRLAEALEIELEITEAEHPVGRFSLDLLGRDLTHDAMLIVENQLEASDHTHLGQLLTYAAGTGAATIVWIAPRIHDEHRQALTWLNEQTGEGTHFFGVELEVVRIGDSIPAPLFNVVVMPNDWQKALKASAAASAAGGKAPLYATFWSTYLEKVHASHPDWTNAKGTTSINWVSISKGAPSGCAFSASFAAKGQLRHELYIDGPSAEASKAMFDSLAASREIFETAYGRQLSWERLDNRKACRIADYRPGSVDDEAAHDDYVSWFIDCGERLRSAVAAATQA